MTNLLPTITPKSDQLNADDLIGRSLTVTVSKVTLSGDADQPIAVHYEGDNGKPYKPCKSMRRVMVHVWGPDGAQFAGRRMTLYRDDEVRFGNAPVGGIRISHMSGIDRDVTMALTATRASRKPYVVRPLPTTKGEPTEMVDLLTVLTEGRAAAAGGSAALTAWWSRLGRDEKAAAKPTLDGELKAAAAKADEAPLDDNAGFGAAPPASDGPPASDDNLPLSDAGDEGEAAGSEQAEAQDPDPAADPNLAIADKLIADLAFETKAELLTIQASGKYRGFVAMLKVTQSEKAAEVEKAMQDALDAFG